MLTKKDILQMDKNGDNLVFLRFGESETAEAIAELSGLDTVTSVTYLSFYEGDTFELSDGSEVFDGDQVYILGGF